MKKLWLVFIAIFVASFAVLGWVGTEIFRQAPPIPREVVTTEGKVVKPKHRDLACRHRWSAHDPTQDASVRRLYPHTQTQPHTGSRTARQAKRLDHLTQSARRASPRLKKRRETLGKDPASALAVVTEEFAHMQDQLYPTASTSQISSRSRVAAMHTRAFLQAARTCCLRQR